MPEPKPLHSPLGASSAERWMNCAGSVALINKLRMEESDEPEYRGLGIAAHELAAECLRQGQDAWELIGTEFHKFLVDKEMADAVQIYLDAVRPAKLNPGAKSYIEHSISHSTHEYFYGTLDDATVYDTTGELTDYKHGEGKFVEVIKNPQIMYYAYGLLLQHPEIETFILRIVQPRISYREPIRVWVVKAEEIRQWAESELFPAMERALVEGGYLEAGKHCQFCPAKLVCPILRNLFKAAATANPQAICDLTDHDLALGYTYLEPVKFYVKAYEEEIYNRLNRGRDIPTAKLVPKRANRVFKPEAAQAALDLFGDEALTKPELKSPSEIDKIGARGKIFTKEYAFTPQTGLTVAAADDSRIGIKMKTTQETFGKALDNLTLDV